MESGLREENPVPLTAVVGGMTTVALLTLVAQAAGCPLLSVHERRSRPHASDAARPILLLRARRTEEKRKRATGRGVECSFVPKAVQTGRVQGRVGPSRILRTPSMGDSGQDGAAVSMQYGICSGRTAWGRFGYRGRHLRTSQAASQVDSVHKPLPYDGRYRQQDQMPTGLAKRHLNWNFRNYLQRRALDGPVVAGDSPTWGRPQR
ncbi:hypothetical protein GGQ20_001457 [Salinibacter ruber]|nr:hypothetical protein [Salinibacter ruber]